MHHSILDNKQVTIMLFFFQQNNFGRIEKLSAPKRKSGFHFFCPLEKKTEQATTQCCEKFAIWFLIDSKFPANRTPHDHFTGLKDGGGVFKKGEGGTISYHLFLGCISFQTYQRKSFRSYATHTHSKHTVMPVSPDPPWSPPSTIS